MKDKCDKKQQQKSFPYYAMATSFFYIYEMDTGFFIYIDIYKKADRTWGNS